MTNLVIFLVIFFGLPVMAMMTLSSVKRRQKLRDDVRSELDPTTQAWLRERELRLRSAKARNSRVLIYWTQNLQQPPAGTDHVLFAFDFKNGTRRGFGTLVGAPARCGPTEVTAMIDMPGAMVRLFEPGFQPMSREECPPGWALAIPPESAPVQADADVPRLLASITPHAGDRSDGAGAPARVVEAVERSWTRLRIHFGPERVYVAVDNPHLRPRAIELAEYIATTLPSHH